VQHKAKIKECEYEKVSREEGTWCEGGNADGKSMTASHLFDVEVYKKTGISRLHGVYNARFAFFVSNIIQPLWK
jgi:hypothetical protein